MFRLHFTLCISGGRAQGTFPPIALQLKFSRTKKKRVIVVGEFNNNIGDAGINTIERAGFRSAWMDLEIDVSKEFIDNARDSQKKLGVIDHIVYNTSANGKSTEGGGTKLKQVLSDHKQILVAIGFPPCGSL